MSLTIPNTFNDGDLIVADQFNANFTAVASAVNALYLTSPQTISADTTWSSRVRVDAGAVITVNTGVTLTINGPFEAGLYQVFAGAGAVVFAGGAGYPEWYAGDLYKAITSGLDVVELSGTYTYPSSSVKIPVTKNGFRLLGGGRANIILSGTDAKNLLWITADRVEISGIQFVGNTEGYNIDGSAVDTLGCAVSVANAEYAHIHHNSFTDFGGSGVWLTSSRYCTVEENVSVRCSNGLNDDDYLFDGTSGLSIGNKWLNNVVQDSIYTGIAIDWQSTAAGTYYSSAFVVEGNTVSGTKLVNGNTYGNGITINSCRGGGSVLNNFCVENEGNGILLDKNTARVTVSHNVCRLNGWNGIMAIYNAPNNLAPSSLNLAGNICNSNTLNGVYLVSGFFAAVAGANILTFNGASGIKVESWQHCGITGNIILGNSRDGIVIDSCYDAQINGNDISVNGYGVSNTYSGIVLTNTKTRSCKNIVISGNNFNAAGTYSQTQKYAINIDSTQGSTDAINSSYIEVSSNLMSDALNTAKYVDNGLGTIITSNHTGIVTGLVAGTTIGYYSVETPYFKLPHGMKVCGGPGTPEAQVAASPGSLYLRTDGDAVTTLYIKTTGTGNTGWTAK